MEGAGSTGARGFARVADEPPLTRRESAVSCGLFVESTSRDSQVSSGRGVGVPRDSASSDPEDSDEACQSGEWLVLRLLPGLLGTSRRWRSPLDRLRGRRS